MSDEAKKYDPMIEQMARTTLAMMDGVTTVADTKGISPEELEAIYQIGHTYYVTGKVDEAEHVFYVLCALSHTTSKFWMALGAARQCRKDYPEALKAYAAAAIFDLHKAKPHFYSAECNFALGDLDSAESGVRSLLEFCPAGTPENDKYRAKAEALMRVIDEARKRQQG